MRRVALLLAITVSLLGLAAAPASAVTAAKVSVTATSAEVRPATAYTVKGSVSPHVARAVVLQRLVGSTWTTVVSSKSGSTGSFPPRGAPQAPRPWERRGGA